MDRTTIEKHGYNKQTKNNAKISYMKCYSIKYI